MTDQEIIARALRPYKSATYDRQIKWYDDKADIILAAIAAERLVIAPKEPTEAMLAKGHADGVRTAGLWKRITPEMALELRMKYLPAAYAAMMATAIRAKLEDMP